MDTSYVICANYPRCRCGFCYRCLKSHFGLVPGKLAGENWVCAVCKGVCDCLRCKDRIKEDVNKFIIQTTAEPRPVPHDQAEEADILVVKEWRREAYLKDERKFTGPKNYAPREPQPVSDLAASSESISPDSDSSDYVPSLEAHGTRRKSKADHRKKSHHARKGSSSPHRAKRKNPEPALPSPQFLTQFEPRKERALSAVPGSAVPMPELRDKLPMSPPVRPLPVRSPVQSFARPDASSPVSQVMFMSPQSRLAYSGREAEMAAAEISLPGYSSPSFFPSMSAMGMAGMDYFSPAGYMPYAAGTNLTMNDLVAAQQYGMLAGADMALPPPYGEGYMAAAPEQYAMYAWPGTDMRNPAGSLGQSQLLGATMTGREQKTGREAPKRAAGA